MPAERRQARPKRDSHDRYRREETRRREYDGDEHDRRPHHAWNYSRSRSPDRSRVHGKQSPSERHQRISQVCATQRGKDPDSKNDEVKKDNSLNEALNEQIDGGNDSEIAIEQAMGFKSFGSTHEKHVIGNNEGAIKKSKPARYRQYMNRNGGFNRELSPG